MRRVGPPAVLALAVALVLTACGPATTSAGRAAGAAVTITWWDTSDPVTESPTFRTLVHDFEEVNPGIEVEYVSVPFTEARARFEAASGKDAPDVLRADVGWTAGLAQAGRLVPLDGTEAAADIAEFEPQLIEQARYGGRLYAVPQSTDVLALLYNKRLFAAAGLSGPPATWSDLKAAAAVIKARTGADGFALHVQGYYAMPFLYGEDVDLVDVPDRTITVNSPAAVKAVTGLKALVSAPGVTKDDGTPQGRAALLAAFSAGRVAAVVEGPWENANVTRGAAFADRGNLGIAPVPAGGSGRAGSPLGGHNLVVSAAADAEHRAAAEKFVAFMTSANAQTWTAVRNSTLPTRSDATTSYVEANPGVIGFRKVLPVGRPRAALAEYGSLYDLFGAELVSILDGRESVRAGLDRAAEQARTLLPDYRS
ncbi:extracellular solute-binding protein [Kitasatospora phosalacinea]|uniref:Sugar ABC transporter substrate-binding protein n=1 Tax=Kitasatospora phosalacinea TaxID=2065 RepID=A0A9W6PH80_9ACTN|nr:extracellular solute-binding protein [Kitasatospora phosalacinea]GLW55056.1 sugar ABC transporter substrate-binding protein [Kitasatospora phosalacinea]